MDDIERDGSIEQHDYVTTEPDDCLTIIYTSGSSGFPKGAMISERTFRAKFPRSYFYSSLERVTLSYRTMVWGAGRNTAMAIFLTGGRTGFSTEDPSRLMEELALVAPTSFTTPPSICNKIYTEYKAALALIIASHPSAAISVEEQRLLQQFSKLIPKRCKTITVGGAMVSPVILNFMKRCFTDCLIYESYGITECGSVTFNNTVDDTLQYRLESIPDMGYTLDDKPFPRGELLTKTAEMFSGYINNPEETHDALTEDGFFRTGDIVELRAGQNGQVDLRVVDRKKNFFKLSQGQFVSPEFLQGIYIQSSFVHQIYIHGDLLSDSVTAVVVPNRDYAQAFALEHNLTHFDMNKPDPQFDDALLKDLRSIAEKELLRKHEIPLRIIIDFEPFTPENGLFTSSMKPCRHKLAAHYADRLKEPSIIEQRLKTIIETATGQSVSADKGENCFLANGGDSMAAVRLSRMIENDLGISLPLSILFEPNLTLDQLTILIKDPSQLSSFSQSIVPQLLTDSNLDLNITVGKRKTTAAYPTMIFVTGTTGFVGAFLLAQILTTYPSTCKVVCLVRSKPLTNPLNRIRQNMSFYRIWKDDYQERIIAVRGDLAKSCFGLDSETYASLAIETDLIFHCGATVNFAFPYSQLYGPNVYGTEQIIRFATSTPSTCIPVQYISTISVLPPSIDKEISIDQIAPNRLVGGYAQSKWVAEKLMAKASRCGLPVVIYRLGLICADSRTGACNQHDVYTLLFAAMMKIGCYPASAIDGHLNGLPVDFTAKSIVYLSSVQPDVYGNIYHVVNPKSEILFEDIIDGMRKCDVQLDSVSYDEWRTKLKELSDRNSPFEYVREFFLDSGFRERCLVSSEHFWNAVYSIELPSLDKDYVLKWLSFIRQNIISK
jgi:fatty acid CoA ligase FadD9